MIDRRDLCGGHITTRASEADSKNELRHEHTGTVDWVWLHCGTRVNRLRSCLGLRVGGLEVAALNSCGARSCDRCRSREAL